MPTLSQRTVRLAATPSSKAEAIGLAADLLARAGHIDPAYEQSMLGREKVANTYLGEGIAIPHGMLKDRELIKSTGLSVVQVPGGVEWNPGEHVRLVVGIAAASDEHLQILANLTRVLADPDMVDELATTDDPDLIVARLAGDGAAAGGTPAAAGTAGAAAAGRAAAVDLRDHAAVDVVVELAHGLHARPATEFVQLAKGFGSDIRVRLGERVANGKSLASLLSVGAGSGASITLLARGDDQDAALAALREAVEGGLGETRRTRPRPARRRPPHRRPPLRPPPPSGPRATPPACPGSPPRPASPSARCGTSSGGGSWSSARRPTSAPSARGCARPSSRPAPSCSTLHDEVAARSGPDEAAIFVAHAAFLDDPDLVDAVDRTIGDGHSAGWAWRETMRGPGGGAAGGRRRHAGRPGRRPGRRRRAGAALPGRQRRRAPRACPTTP